MASSKLDTAYIRAVRVAKRHLQRDLAAALGISRSEYSRIEAGKVEVNSTQIVEMATMLEVPVQMLFRIGPRHKRNCCLGHLVLAVLSTATAWL